MNEFRLCDIMCKFDCRYGLGHSDYKICRHVSHRQMQQLANDLAAVEHGMERESDLFRTVLLYVDDPMFWAMCLNFRGKLQRHSPLWLQNAFVTTTKHQLLRLSGKQLTKCDQDLFLERIEQLLAITQHNKIDNLDQDIEYWVSNIERVNRYDE